MDPQFEIIKLEKSFRNKKLAIKNSFYDKDGVHLNEDGAEMLAKVIFDKTRRIPYNFFE